MVAFRMGHQKNVRLFFDPLAMGHLFKWDQLRINVSSYWFIRNGISSYNLQILVFPGAVQGGGGRPPNEATNFDHRFVFSMHFKPFYRLAFNIIFISYYIFPMTLCKIYFLSPRCARGKLKSI